MKKREADPTSGQKARDLLAAQYERRFQLLDQMRANATGMNAPDVAASLAVLGDKAKTYAQRARRKV